MKRTIVMMLALLLCISVLAGCGSNDNGHTAENTADMGNAVDTAGKTHSTGVFRVHIPEGWLEIPFTLNGEHNPSALGVYKGANSQFDMLTTPSIQINCPSSRARISARKGAFTNVSDIKPLALANYTWEGFTGEYSGAPYAILWDAEKKDDFQVTICLEMGTKISLADADVLAILASIELESGGEQSSPAAAAGIEGKYQMTIYEINGEDMIGFFAALSGDAFDPGLLYIELKSVGQCLVSTDGDPAECTYVINGDAIEIDVDGEIMKGTVTADTITIEDEDAGNTMLLVFEKNGAVPIAPKAAFTGDGMASGVQEKWNGIWYGYMLTTDYVGAYEGSEDDLLDAYMEIEVNENGVGTMTIYLGASDDYLPFDTLYDRTFIEATISADEHHLKMLDGQILDEYGNAPLDPAGWWLGLSPLTDEPAVVISDTYRDSENDGFDYMFSFRTFGSRWEDQIGKESHKRLPPGYDGYIAELSGDTSGKPVGSGAFGGEGFMAMSYKQFKEALDKISDLSWTKAEGPVTYEVVVNLLGGVEGKLKEDSGDYVYYEWFTNDGGGGTITFTPKDGTLVYSGYGAWQ